MKLIRLVLGKIILFFDAAFVPESEKRSPEAQAKVDAEAKSLVLYQLNACPFCVKVRRGMKRLGVTIELKDIGTDAKAHAELMAGGKLDQAPCLRITDSSGAVSWLYESSDILAHLEKRFS